MNEDKTSNETNDELEANDTTHGEHNSQDEGDDAESQAQASSDERTYTEAELNERLEQERKERDKRWKERLKKAQSSDESGEESRPQGDQKSEQKEVASDDRYDRLELKMDGITSKDAQDAIIEYARFKNISVSEAANSPVMKAELKELEAKAATPAPGNRTGHTDRSDDVNYWVEQQKKGKSAPNAEMRRKVRQILSGR